MNYSRFKVYDHNIRCIPSSLMQGEASWNERKKYCLSSMQFFADNDTFICLQEVVHGQLMDIARDLGNDWGYIGVGRDDGYTRGEYNPIFYCRSSWGVVESKNYWLSPTPEKPSNGWGADLNRVLTHARFRHKKKYYMVNVLNTHFDHLSVLARTNSAHQVIDVANSITCEPVVVTGDFNAPPEEECYKIISEALYDASLTSKIKYGPEVTYVGFDDSYDQGLIDYIWTNKKTVVTRFGVLPCSMGGPYFSDHCPLLAEFETGNTM
ncbi:hypothetical protein KL912_004590 [Ogataea haglerorum]|nr:hypothetical protein KL912_004590 [Ogataea haglerorum]KAG7785145.1 hypothetical protein KL945_003910 [Ogataea haglerorum]KAG7785613.1 hypothetical protein KL910_004525 [Ogataea haglerorum]